MSTPLNYDQLVASRRQLLQSLVASDYSLIGYIYPHAPLELFLAHQLIPVLLWADPQVTGAYEASLQTFCCAYSRNLFSQRAKERLPRLSALVFPGGTCDSLQNLGDVWKARFPDDAVLRITYPVARDEAAATFLARELQNFSYHLEGVFGQKFSLRKYQEAIALIAEFRAAAQFITAARLLQPTSIPYAEYSRLVRQFLTAPSPLSLQPIENAATEVQAALRTNQMLPQTEALRYGLLTANLSDLTFTPKPGGPRIMVVGGMVDPEGIAVLFENAKTAADIETAEIVLDFLSFTFRTIFTPTPSLHADPYQELAEKILSAPSEPTHEGLQDRLAFLDTVLSRLGIEGVIICEQSFCDPDQFEVPELQKLAEKIKIPTVRLPLDPEFSDRARLEGRIQSFLETLSI
ncbi:MAG: 2-hydroxyacyl-CoA dehydratase family protein [Candidatus Hermodarchaeota archaeon]|nr:2-hydroxyacyl-CoA dehydratase family protein [Candidatus Hermodarchaeota archaeon]